MTTKELDNEYVAHAYGRFDVVPDKGSGSVLYSEDGKKYYDEIITLADSLKGESDFETLKNILDYNQN